MSCDDRAYLCRYGLSEAIEDRFCRLFMLG